MTQSLGGAWELSSGTLTGHTVFSICGKLMGYFPVCKGLCAAIGMIKRRTSMVTNGWHDTVKDVPIKQMIVEMFIRVLQDDPTQRDWCVAGEEANLWVDASSLAMGIVLENCGATLEDVCWLQPIN